ncbi:hypothetical protein [Allocoleopsis franciscana]|uniref:Uncharacterized protein n=1 Tax=Allocoleopsis franciscana PCC 7113 TaxID=1173027 RepID=K9WHA3_9CYAN|nr:hypothetical protein [Allocoleopsis franciscana]AFZ19800.1 hypothetical protein Mic7113_4098 [Allocoleopsis franciscana PCC 7113]
MSTYHNKKSFKQVLTLIGVASASALLALPAFAQINPGNTQQNPVGTSGTPETQGGFIPQPQVPPVGNGTVPQTLGNPVSQPQVPSIGNGTVPQSLGNPSPSVGTDSIFQNPRGRGPIFQFPGSTNQTQPNTQINGM